MDQVVRTLALAERDLLISVHTSHDPSNAEWDLFVQALKEAEARKHGDLSHVMILMLGDGGSPDTLMREALNKVLLGRPLRIAAVTDSIVGRGVVTAISWFNPQIRACSPSKPKDVFTHLGLSAEESKRAIEALTAISRLMPGVVSLSTLLSSFASASATPRA